MSGRVLCNSLTLTLPSFFFLEDFSCWRLKENRLLFWKVGVLRWPSIFSCFCVFLNVPNQNNRMSTAFGQRESFLRQSDWVFNYNLQRRRDFPQPAMQQLVCILPLRRRRREQDSRNWTSSVWEDDRLWREKRCVFAVIDWCELWWLLPLMLKCFDERWSDGAEHFADKTILSSVKRFTVLVN